MHDHIRDLQAAWGITVGEQLHGATESHVFGATANDGTPAVLKLADPEDLGREVRVLERADGRGCVRVLAHDAARGAVLLERLGRQLHESGLGVRDEIDVICNNLPQLWAVDATGLELPTTRDKAAWSIELIRTEGIHTDVIELAERRADAFDPSGAVLLHGDAHAWNTLEHGDGGYRFVDPDGLTGEREYDLAISMREFTDELLEGDAYRIGRARAEYLAARTDADAQAIWEWGIVERVTNGIVYLREGDPAAAQPFLTVAERWYRA